jgi:dUTP pyrophosphatase
MAYLLVKRLTDKAKIPTKGSAYAAGYDLYAAEGATVLANGRQLIKTGLAMTVPSGHYGRIAPRSGLAVNYGIGVGAGVIDEDFLGEIKILLMNHGNNDLLVKEGDRIAQLIIEKISLPEVKEVNELGNTTRGSGGFGSTGR